MQGKNTKQNCYIPMMETFTKSWKDDEEAPFTKQSLHGSAYGITDYGTRLSSAHSSRQTFRTSGTSIYVRSEQQCLASSSSSGRALGTVRACLSFLFCTDMILKFFIVLFYGIFPCAFKKPRKKLCYIWISTILTLAQWNCLVTFIYFVATVWSSGVYGPVMPKETKFISITLQASGTVTYTLVVYYFYTKSNDFRNSRSTSRSCDGRWRIIPRVKFHLAGHSELGDQEVIDLDKKDWLITNAFLATGLFSTVSVISTDEKFNIFYDYVGIHDFVEKVPWPTRIQYYIEVSTYFLALAATPCACCIFFVLTRDLIRHIEYTENAILVKARNRDDFYFYHECLLEYCGKMIASFKHWFAVHSLFFVILITAVVYEWFKMLQREKQLERHFTDMLLAQIAGSSLIAFKFAFPFISASRVTARFILFYYNISRKCKIQGIPDLIILSNNSGFKLYGLRITTSTAFLAFFASFAGALKFISGLKY